MTVRGVTFIFDAYMIYIEHTGAHRHRERERGLMQLPAAARKPRASFRHLPPSGENSEGLLPNRPPLVSSFRDLMQLSSALHELRAACRQIPPAPG